MSKEKLGKRLSALALTGIIASATLLPCTVNATEIIEKDNTKMVSSESVAKKGRKQGKKMSVRKQTSGDTIKKGERKAKFKNLSEEEKEALKAERDAKKAEKKAKYENLSDEEKEALKAKKSQDGGKEKAMKGKAKSKKPKQDATA